MIIHEQTAFEKMNALDQVRITQMAISILKYINANDYNFNYFYVGITNDIDRRKAEHDKEFNSVLVYHHDFKDREFVKALEAYFTMKYGFRGDTGGGSDDSTTFYVLRLL